MKMSQGYFQQSFASDIPHGHFVILCCTLMPCNCVSLPLIKLTSNLNGYHLPHWSEEVTGIDHSFAL